MKCTIVNREEGLEAGGVSDNMLKFWSPDNTSALESRLVIRAVQKIELCLAKRLVFFAKISQKLGSNCSIYDCGTNRKHKDISIFQIPTKYNDLSTQTREAWVHLVTRDRE